MTQEKPKFGEEILIGRGRLMWEGQERRSDRYGFVYLLESGDSTTPTCVLAGMAVRPEHLGLRARLQATVLEARQSTHIGDLFHGVFPSTPEVGERIILGTGLLTVMKGFEGQMRVGLFPFDDERETMWLDIGALYRCHEQTVELRYAIFG